MTPGDVAALLLMACRLGVHPAAVFGAFRSVSFDVSASSLGQAICFLESRVSFDVKASLVEDIENLFGDDDTGYAKD